MLLLTTFVIKGFALAIIGLFAVAIIMTIINVRHSRDCENYYLHGFDEPRALSRARDVEIVTIDYDNPEAEDASVANEDDIHLFAQLENCSPV